MPDGIVCCIILDGSAAAPFKRATAEFHSVRINSKRISLPHRLFAAVPVSIATNMAHLPFFCLLKLFTVTAGKNLDFVLCLSFASRN